MEHMVFGLFLVFVRCILMFSGAHAYPALQSVFDNFGDNSIESNNRQPSTAFGSRADSDRVSGTGTSSENQVSELEDVKESLENVARGLVNPIDQLPLAIDLTSPAVREAIRRALLTKRPGNEDRREDALNRLRSLLTHVGKRGWSRVSVQTRFAPFGTKLVPNRKLENGGATLLRYGRNGQNH